MPTNLERLKVVKEVSRNDIFFGLARVPQSDRLFVGGSDFKLYQVDMAAEKPELKPISGMETASHESYVTDLVLTGSRLVSGSYDGRLMWWDAESGAHVRTVNAHSKWIRRLTTSPDGKTVISVADDMVCRLWNADSGELLRELKGHAAKTPHHFPSMLFCCAVSNDGRLLATADKTGHVVVWDFSTGREMAAVEAPIMYTWDPKQRIHSIGGVRSVAFSPDAKLLAVGGTGTIGNVDHLEAGSRIEIFEWEKNQRVHEIKEDKHKGLVERLEFHPSGAWLAAAGGDHGGFLQFLDPTTGKAIRQEKAPMHVHDLAFNEDFTKAYTVGHGRLTMWTMEG